MQLFDVVRRTITPSFDFLQASNQFAYIIKTLLANTMTLTNLKTQKGSISAQLAPVHKLDIASVAP
jgi:hypothetical protein